MFIYIAFIVWANDELEYFVSKFSRQVFHCDITLAAIGICVGIATRHSNKVCRIVQSVEINNEGIIFIEIFNPIFNNYWMRLSMISRIIKTEVNVICRSEGEADKINRGLDDS